MGKTEKKINKLLIGAIIGSALISAGSFSMTPKGKSFWRHMLRKSKRWTRFWIRGVKELKKEFFGGSSERNTNKKGSRTRKKIGKKRVAAKTAE